MMLKVALVGNMNNNFFSFARYLRDEEIDAHLYLLNNEYSHFLPEADSFDTSWQEYTYTLDWGSIDSFANVDSKTIWNQFNSYDLLIGCGTTPAFFEQAGLYLDIFIPYGSDLYSLPFFRLVKPKNLKMMWDFTRKQAKGIRNAGNVFMAPTTGKLEKYLDKLHYRRGQIYNCGVPMVYWKQYDTNAFEELKKKSELYQRIVALRNQGKFVIIHPSRHSWKNPADAYSQKGNDRLFRAVGELNKTVDNKIVVVTFEYGVDVEATKNLLEEIGMSEQVIWIKQSDRLDIMCGISEVDLVVGELEDSYLTYGIVYESMALKKPIMHSCRPSDFSGVYETIYPMYSANSVETIYNHLQNILANRDALIQTGREANKWFRKYLTEEPLDAVKEIAARKLKK